MPMTFYIYFFQKKENIEINIRAFSNEYGNVNDDDFERSHICGLLLPHSAVHKGFIFAFLNFVSRK